MSLWHNKILKEEQEPSEWVVLLFTLNIPSLFSFSFFFATCVYTCLFSCFQGCNKWSFTSLIYLYKTSENSDICQCKFLKVQGDVFYCLLLSVQQEQSHWRVCQSTISWSADHCSSLSHSLWAASSIHSCCWKAAGFCCYQPAVIMWSIVWNSLILVQNDQVPIC